MTIGAVYEEHRKIVDGARERFRKGEISELLFRLVLVTQGFNPTEIDAEVDLIQKGF